MPAEHLLEGEGVVQRYPGMVALDGVRIQVRPGTVHAVMGENGAGASIPITILAGNVRSTEGEIRVMGQPRHFHGRRDATDAIVLIDQELLGSRQAIGRSSRAARCELGVGQAGPC
jgi:ABC-type sugar transport system ATPase subunit